MNVILFDNPVVRLGLLPFTFTRPVACIRVGILTISEKWEKYLNTTVSYGTESYLQKKYPLRHAADNLWINGAVCPDASLVTGITQLKSGDAIMKDNMIIAVRTPDDEVPEVITGIVTDYKEPLVLIDNLCKIFQNNGAQIRVDFTLITKGRKSAPITDEHTRVYNK